MYFNQNLAVSSAPLEIGVFPLVRIFETPCGKKISERKQSVESALSKVEGSIIKTSTCHFSLTILLWRNFDILSKTNLRLRSIKNMLVAPGQTMNTSGHGVFEHDKDVLIYKYHQCNAKKVP